MNTLRAAAFLSWLVALLGVVMRWDALSSAPGGYISSWPSAALGGALIAAVFSLFAIALHIVEIFRWSKRRRKVSS